jgi:hypothetical protein
LWSVVLKFDLQFLRECEWERGRERERERERERGKEEEVPGPPLANQVYRYLLPHHLTVYMILAAVNFATLFLTLTL